MYYVKRIMRALYETNDIHVFLINIKESTIFPSKDMKATTDPS